ncbi:hypothetical protein SAMN04488021_12223 [Paracoccus aminovorans]|uniref:Uncharacterized protein n=1 Tax=Paracoccus aminovorans TaxID=34004 RepID=A0A1I3BIP2_9RHOB|nr:hypothetical protein [Paracoccus aminovorans]CQR87093.1 hypothetical protein JCM7685_2548 [Paracoccus aminovorans]SFH62030.1 hypothetical protein SAMN04488021_12223 [Paracoccus aminovorans]
MVDKCFLRTPFAVTTYLKASSQEEPASDVDYATLEEASAAFHAAKKDPNVFAYLLEIGVFADNKDNLKVDHMVFDTNDFDWWRSVSPLNRLGSRGFGRPTNHGDYAVEYKPVAELNWRL